MRTRAYASVMPAAAIISSQLSFSSLLASMRANWRPISSIVAPPKNLAITSLCLATPSPHSWTEMTPSWLASSESKSALSSARPSSVFSAASSCVSVASDLSASRRSPAVNSASVILELPSASSCSKQFCSKTST